jgi:hypothetical protein
MGAGLLFVRLRFYNPHHHPPDAAHTSTVCSREQADEETIAGWIMIQAVVRVISEVAPDARWTSEYLIEEF